MRDEIMSADMRALPGIVRQLGERMEQLSERLHQLAERIDRLTETVAALANRVDHMDGRLGTWRADSMSSISGRTIVFPS